MMLIVTVVGLAIHVYSLGYMHGDPSKGRFFGKLSLFVFSMLGIVVSPNFIQTFVFWELVGVSSYLLIGYYWEKDSAGEAAKKAFMTNRVGDFGFLLGILIVWSLSGTFDFAELAAQLRTGATATTSRCSAARSRSARPSSSAAPWARARSSRCTSGCPTPWRARRRCRR